MGRSFEILFVDPSVADVGSILSSVRMGVEAIVLDSVRPPARQIAAALATRRDLSAVHVIAHGAPGRVSFAAGDWSFDTLPEEADELAAIGEALGRNGDLRLWSCHTGAGAIGGAFIAALARATGAQVSAASGFVGAAALGGVWELTARTSAVTARPPLTEAGIAAYAAVLATKSWNTGSGNWGTGGNWNPTGVPAAGDDVSITRFGTYTVTVDVNTNNLNSLTLNR